MNVLHPHPKVFERIINNFPHISLAYSTREDTDPQMLAHITDYLDKNSGQINPDIIQYVFDGKGNAENIAFQAVANTEAYRKLGYDPERSWHNKASGRETGGACIPWNETIRHLFGVGEEILRVLSPQLTEETQRKRLFEIYGYISEIKKGFYPE